MHSSRTACSTYPPVGDSRRNQGLSSTHLRQRQLPQKAHAPCHRYEIDETSGRGYGWNPHRLSADRGCPPCPLARSARQFIERGAGIGGNCIAASAGAHRRNRRSIGNSGVVACSAKTPALDVAGDVKPACRNFCAGLLSHAQRAPCQRSGAFEKSAGRLIELLRRASCRG